MTDRDLLSSLQRLVIEPPDGGVTWPSRLWTKDEVLGYLTRRQDQFQRLTHLQLGIARIDEQANVDSYLLPDDYIATFLVFRLANGTSRELPLRSAFEADHAGTSQTSGVPIYCEDLGVASRTVRLFPPPAAPGILLVFYVPAPPEPTGSGDPLPYPDELTDTGIKWGVMADMLLKVGRPQDVPRADYALQRWKLAQDAVTLILKGWA